MDSSSEGPFHPKRRIIAGTTIEDALRAFHESVNQPGTIFSRDHWLMPKFERLRRLLSEPITEDQATALLDVLYQRHWMADLIEWLESPPVSWALFFECSRLPVDGSDGCRSRCQLTTIDTCEQGLTPDVNY